MNLFHSYLINSPWMGVISFMLAALLAALSCYFVARNLLGSRIAEDSELLAGRIIARLGALHALILALMFAQEMADYRDISRIVSRAVNAIGDVHNGLQEYDEENPKSTAAIADRIVHYVKTIHVDRATVAEARSSNRAWIYYQQINRELRKLRPTNGDQKDMRALMLADWDVVSEIHHRIRAAAEYESPDIFWVVLIAGFFATVIPCYVYSPKIANIVTLSTFAALNGLVMYVIFAIENPFSGAVAIDASALENLLAMMGSAAR